MSSELVTAPTSRSAVSKRQAAWTREVASRLPGLLTQLVESPIYGLSPDRPPPPEKYGVYLFADAEDTPLYVGRVGLTDRSRLAGKRFSSFRTRIRAHTQPRHNSGTFAYAKTCERFREEGRALAGARAANCQDPEFMAEFRHQCDLLRNSGVRIVEINDNKLSAVFEIYAATVLGLPQSFATS